MKTMATTTKDRVRHRLNMLYGSIPVTPNMVAKRKADDKLVHSAGVKIRYGRSLMGRSFGYLIGH